MGKDDMKSTILELDYIGEDFWSRPVYKDQFGKLWKDVELGQGTQPSLHASTGNEFDGEPDFPIEKEFIVRSAPKIDEEKRFRYMMLGRWKSDCNYYLGYGNRNPSRLCADTPKEHIDAIKKLWLSFAEDEKPEWLTWEQLLQYEKEMCSDEA